MECQQYQDNSKPEQFYAAIIDVDT